MTGSETPQILSLCSNGMNGWFTAYNVLLLFSFFLTILASEVQTNSSDTPNDPFLFQPLGSNFTEEIEAIKQDGNFRRPL